VLVTGGKRTLVANLAAACKYSLDHLDANMDMLKGKTFIYSSAFFITSNNDALVKVG